MEDEIMKKVLVGFLAGVIVTAAGTAYADDIVSSIVGKTVQGSFPVKVDGKQLTSQAAVIDGTSYLPVRAVGEALNKEVTFDAELGIELKEKEGTPVTAPTQQPTATSIPAQPISKQEQIDELKVKLEDQKQSLETYNGLIKVNESTLADPNVPKESVQKTIDGYKKIVTEIQQRISEYEAQIAAIEAQK